MDVVDEARNAKNRAMDERDLENWEDALEILNTATKSLKGALADLGQRPHDQDAELREFETRAKKQLYHLLGSIGGIYRRRARTKDAKPQDLVDAIKSYDAGLAIEKEFTDSYNLTQRLVTRVLLQPGATSDEWGEIEGVHVREALRRAKVILDGQTDRTGPRANDEYAFADAMIVALLLYDPGWADAVKEFLTRVPTSSYARNVTVEVLEELVEGVDQRGGDAGAPLQRRLAEALRMVKR